MPNKIGKVFKYFRKPGVAGVEIEREKIRLNDILHFKGENTDFKQEVQSIELDGEKVNKAEKGTRVGIKVKNRVRPNDKVFLIEDKYQNVEQIQNSVKRLKDEEEMIDAREIESALEEDEVERAGKLLEELKEKYQEYKETIEKLESLDQRKSSLATQLADKEIDRDTYNDAVNNIETEKARLEEKLNKLRKEVIYEDYEKPF